MNAVARWVAEVKPEAFVTDVSVEVTMFVRLLGIPVIVMALPGERVDAPHQLVHDLADHIVAAWPQQLYVPEWLRLHAGKTSYVGGISRFEARIGSMSSDVVSPDGIAAPQEQLRVLVLGGASEEFGAFIADCEQACPGTTWTALGGTGGRWTDDPWPEISTADVVVTHAGQSCVADVAAARRPAVVIPQPRPFDEQQATAAVLRREGLATVVQRWPDTREWAGVLARVRAGDPHSWDRWQVKGASARAAKAIESTARRCATAAAV